ncbi:MAG: hypothetical protein BWX64_02620 [Acidobacteria bacterium ADurb.Bin051]|nr:MAG: hypothetical protein BWX64_02620 [Acidobacteria bacterium ADurb.Bin051]
MPLERLDLVGLLVRGRLETLLHLDALLLERLIEQLLDLLRSHPRSRRFRRHGNLWRRRGATPPEEEETTEGEEHHGGRDPADQTDRERLLRRPPRGKAVLLLERPRRRRRRCRRDGGHRRGSGDRPQLLGRDPDRLLRFDLLALPVDLLAEERMHVEGEVEGGRVVVAVGHQARDRLVPGGRVGEALIARRQALLEEVGERRRQRRTLHRQRRLAEQSARPLRAGGEPLAGEQLVEQHPEAVNVVGLVRRLSGERLGRQVAGESVLEEGMSRRAPQAPRHLEAEQPRLSLVGDHDQVRHEEAVQHPPALGPGLVGHREPHRGALGDQQPVIEGDRTVPFARLIDQGSEMAAGDVVVGDERHPADLTEIDAEPQVRAAQRLRERPLCLEVVGETAAVDSLAVEDAQQQDPLEPALAHLASPEGLPERIFPELLQQQIAAELLPRVHPLLLQPADRGPFATWALQGRDHLRPEYGRPPGSANYLTPPRAARASSRSRRHRSRQYCRCQRSTARECSASVREKTWEPSFRLTK